ncbi:MAG: 50S ribosomal protein L28 [Bacteroidia bacterium]
MSKVCQITGKKAIVGNKVSHSNHKTKRQFKVNLLEKTFVLEDKTSIKLKLSTSGLRTINKIGINEAVKRARENGFLPRAK